MDMRELLTNNISLLQQLDAFGGLLPPTVLGTGRPKLREVSMLSTWVYCFLAYVGLRSPDPHTRQMMAYRRLIIHEAQDCGGRGWLDYDRIFWQQAALDQTLPWNCVHPNI